MTIGCLKIVHVVMPKAEQFRLLKQSNEMSFSSGKRIRILVKFTFTKHPKHKTASLKNLHESKRHFLTYSQMFKLSFDHIQTVIANLLVPHQTKNGHKPVNQLIHPSLIFPPQLQKPLKTLPLAPGLLTKTTPSFTELTESGLDIGIS